MNPRINVAKLASHFNNWQKCRKTNNAHWIPKWEASIKEQLALLPQGGSIKDKIIFDWNDSSPGNLLFLLAVHQRDENRRHCGFTYHELSIQTQLKGINLELMGKDQDGRPLEDNHPTMKYLYALFHNTFYYQPDYHKNKRSIKLQLRERYKHLKNRLGRINLNIPQLKKTTGKILARIAIIPKILPNQGSDNSSNN